LIIISLLESSKVFAVKVAQSCNVTAMIRVRITLELTCGACRSLLCVAALVALPLAGHPVSSALTRTLLAPR
jgi:hypothetical protein